VEKREKSVFEKVVDVISYIAYLAIVLVLALQLLLIVQVPLYVYLCIVCAIMVLKCIAKWKHERGNAIVYLMSSVLMLATVGMLLLMR